MEVARREIMKLGAATMLAASAAPVRAVREASFRSNFDKVDPELRPAALRILQMDSGMAGWSRASLARMRSHAPAPPEQRSTVPVDERRIPRGVGQPDLTVFVVNPGRGSSRPGILHTHGGGYILGSARSEIPYLQGIARDLECVIVSVEYRLAPETGYAGSIEDNYAGLRWAHRNAAALGIDPTRLVVMGESAGGGHAALLALLARDRREIPLAAQILVYPMLDDRTGSTVAPPPGVGIIGWNAEGNRFGWRSFLGREPGGRDVPAAAVPARRKDLADLPPAFVGVGAIDLFVGEDITYARRLIEAGVPTDVLVVPGAFHGFDRVAPETRVAQIFNKAKYNMLRRAFGRPVQP